MKKISIMAPISCMNIKMKCAQNRKNINLSKLSVLDSKQRLKCLGKMFPVQFPARVLIFLFYVKTRHKKYYVIRSIDIVSSQLYVCHILVSKKCQLQAGTIGEKSC